WFAWEAPDSQGSSAAPRCYPRSLASTFHAASLIGSYETRNAEVGTRNRWANSEHPRSAFRVPRSAFPTAAAPASAPHAKSDAAAWVALAKRAGVRYITITSRHHDGFSMFKTTQTPYNIVDWTPFRRDPLQELADACHAAGVKLFFYYSQLDWHHPDYWPR